MQDGVLLNLLVYQKAMDIARQELAEELELKDGLIKRLQESLNINDASSSTNDSVKSKEKNGKDPCRKSMLPLPKNPKLHQKPPTTPAAPKGSSQATRKKGSIPVIAQKGIPLKSERTQLVKVSKNQKLPVGQALVVGKGLGQNGGVSIKKPSSHSSKAAVPKNLVECTNDTRREHKTAEETQSLLEQLSDMRKSQRENDALTEDFKQQIKEMEDRIEEGQAEIMRLRDENNGLIEKAQRQATLITSLEKDLEESQLMQKEMCGVQDDLEVSLAINGTSHIMYASGSSFVVYSAN